jgi:hypothetical protein
LVPDEELVTTQISSSSARDTQDEEVAAAIAVAWALRSLEVSGSELGTALEAGRGPWWVMSQLQWRPVGTRTSRGRRQR